MPPIPMGEPARPRREPILSVRNLETHFLLDEGVVRAVDGTSFDLFSKQTLGIVGESGCGKSVTARSILGIVESPGKVVGGEVMLRRDGAREMIDLAKLDPKGDRYRAIRGAEIALVFQEPMSSFSAYHTVGNQIIEAIRLHQPLTKKQARNKAIDLLHMVGVPKPDRRIDEYSFELSGGLRQRVMVAMALSSDPRILIADEPTTALDVTTQAQVLDLLRQLQDERDLAIILITHDMGVIAEMADDVVVMYLGKEVENGPVDDIFHNPKHPYTRSLLNSIPSILARPRSKLSTIEGSIPHPYARPPGCPFHPRCTVAIPGLCDSQTPRFLPMGDRQGVSCFLHHGPSGQSMPSGKDTGARHDAV